MRPSFLEPRPAHATETWRIKYEKSDSQCQSPHVKDNEMTTTGMYGETRKDNLLVAQGYRDKSGALISTPTCVRGLTVTDIAG